MSDKREPGWTTFRRHRPIMLSEDAPDGILINTGVKRQIDLVSNMGTAPGRIALLQLNNQPIKSAAGPFGPSLVFCLGENNSRYLRCTSAR